MLTGFNLHRKTSTEVQYNHMTSVIRKQAESISSLKNQLAMSEAAHKAEVKQLQQQHHAEISQIKQKYKARLAKLQESVQRHVDKRTKELEKKNRQLAVDCQRMREVQEQRRQIQERVKEAHDTQELIADVSNMGAGGRHRQSTRISLRQQYSSARWQCKQACTASTTPPTASASWNTANGHLGRDSADIK
jgi:rubrerythrin